MSSLQTKLAFLAWSKDGKTTPYPLLASQGLKILEVRHPRVRFDLKPKLEALGSSSIIRAGSFPDVLGSIVQHYADHKDGPQVAAVWMTKGFLLEEVKEQQAIASFRDEVGIRSAPFRDHKRLIDK